MTAAPYDAHLGRIVEHVGSWATVELMRGLLARDDVLDRLGQGVTVPELAAVGGASERQVLSLLLSLEVEDVVQRDDGGRWELSAFGRALRERRGWLELLVNGYGAYFRNSEKLWRGDVDPAWRDMRAVGQSSVGISRHGALPLVLELMHELNPDGRLVVDVGCANADYLIAMCQSAPALAAIGVEPAASLRADALRSIDAAGLGDRVRIIETVDAIADELDAAPDFFVFGFVLHELHEQRGRAWLRTFLQGLGQQFPDAWLLVVEADVSARADVERMRSDPHLRGYYNPYYLLHDFTDQTLLSRAEWLTLFEEAELDVRDVRPIDARFDPTGQEIGFAVRRRPSPPVGEALQASSDALALLDYNENSAGTSRAAARRIAAHLDELHRYPRGLYEEATAAVAAYLGVAPECVLLTVGVDEATDLVLLECDAGFMFTPGFDGFWDRAHSLGVETVVVALGEDWQPAPHCWARVPRGAAVLVAQPNNPTGNWFRDPDWLNEAADRSRIVLLDETYAEYGAGVATAEHSNVCRFRSFSKGFGLAALRVGAMVGEERLIASLARRKRFHEVDALSLHGVLGALEDPDAIGRSIAAVRDRRPRYAALLGAHGTVFDEVIESAANFVVASAVGGDVDWIVHELRSQAIWVTGCGRLGLDGWVRVTVGSEEELARLGAALADVERERTIALRATAVD